MCVCAPETLCSCSGGHLRGFSCTGAGPKYMEVTKSPFIPRCSLPYIINVAGVSVAHAGAEPMTTNRNQNDTKIPAPYSNEWR